MMWLKKLFSLIAFLGFFWLLPTAQADVTHIDKYKKAIEINPKDFVAHLGLGRAYQKLGLYENAIAEYKEALRWEPIYSAAYQGMGGSYGEMRQYKKSLEAYQKAVDLDPNYAEAQYGLGWSMSLIHILTLPTNRDV